MRSMVRSSLPSHMQPSQFLQRHYPTTRSAEATVQAHYVQASPLHSLFCRLRHYRLLLLVLHEFLWKDTGRCVSLSHLFMLSLTIVT